MTLETANRLYELRKKHNLSQEELAEKLGVSRQAVSKWERSEASPDTDNLIALAKIYGLSLDELIYGERSSENEEAKVDGENKSEKKDESDNEYTGTEADGDSIFTVEEGGNRVTVNPSCILVEDEDGETVKIGLSGIRIESKKSLSDDESDEDKSHGIIIDTDGHVKIKVEESKKTKTKFWLEVPYAVICTVAYLIFGFYNICGGWAHSWIIFITIPIYYTLVEAIYARRFSEFGGYPILMAFLYLYFGLYLDNWHPSWIIFITIPIYYSIADALDKLIRSRKKEK
ncbi:MAG: helix-turn-helix transcriptional regulator [Clostridia bacterium]|nr:helix-turn-helix transcriptional regulator [Clostridia bacterium]